MSEINQKFKKIDIAKIFEFADLSAYPLRQRLAIRLIGAVAYVLINILGKTIRFETEGWENFEKTTSTNRAFVGAFWHDCTFSFAYFWRNRGFVSMVSRSFDGEYLARILQRFGCGVIRGSTTDGGRAAFAGMIRLLREGYSTNFAIDGPRGPRHVAKSGAILLAKKSGAPVIPFWVDAKKFWTAGSWDRLQIPKPFTRVKIYVSAPIFVSAGADKNEIEDKRQELQTKLDELVALGKQWRETVG